ncbi:hypothetical protein [Kitasatospora sp. NPDC057015]|uniref:hypothetical protein n=1 Tax=Kitasatospora sp. NPDC057015 TaxID=3346001 RepID=UPI003645D6BE
MRRITATTTCLLLAVVALSGCSGGGSGDDKASTSATATATATVTGQTSAPAPAPAAPPSPSAAAGGGAAPGAAATTGAPKGWPANSAQFTTVAEAALRMATVITKAHGDAETVGKECAILAGRVGGLQAESAAPPEWALVIADLQKASARCDAVRSDKAGAYEELDNAFFSAWGHLQPLIDHS